MTTPTPTDGLAGGGPQFKSTDAEGLQGAATTFTDTCTNLDLISANVNIAVQELPWEGEAGPKFKALMEDWKGESDKIHAELNAMAALCQRTGNIQVQAEGEATQKATF
jgi:hypothetical protein